MGLALQDHGGGHGRYDPTAGAAPQEPTLAADAPSFINGIFRDICCNYTPVTFAHPAMQPGKPSCERKLYDIVVVVVR